MKIIYVVVVLTQLWNGSWLEHETSLQYDNLPDCIKATNHLKNNTNPLPDGDEIRPIRRNTNKYECRNKVIWDRMEMMK